MAASYRKKKPHELIFDANKKRLRCEGAIILAEVLNEALAVMDEQFQDALLKGEVRTIGGSRDELLSLLRIASDRYLGPLTPVVGQVAGGNPRK